MNTCTKIPLIRILNGASLPRWAYQAPFILMKDNLFQKTLYICCIYNTNLQKLVVSNKISLFNECLIQVNNRFPKFTTNLKSLARKIFCRIFNLFSRVGFPDVILSANIVIKLLTTVFTCIRFFSCMYSHMYLHAIFCNKLLPTIATFMIQHIHMVG